MRPLFFSLGMVCLATCALSFVSEEQMVLAEMIRGKKCVEKQSKGTPNPQCQHRYGLGSSCPSTVTVNNALKHCVKVQPGERCNSSCYQWEDYTSLTYNVTQTYSIGGKIYQMADIVCDVLCNPLGKIIFRAMPVATIILELACVIDKFGSMVPPDLCAAGMIICTAASTGTKSGSKVDSCL